MVKRECIECRELKLKEDRGAGGIEGTVPVGLVGAMTIVMVFRGIIFSGLGKEIHPKRDT